MDGLDIRNGHGNGCAGCKKWAVETRVLDIRNGSVIGMLGIGNGNVRGVLNIRNVHGKGCAGNKKWPWKWVAGVKKWPWK